MKKLFVILSVAITVMLIVSFEDAHITVTKHTAYNDSLEKDREKYIALVSARISGKEEMTVDSVFTNLKVLGGFPAKNLLFAMSAWSRGLGVSCGHCHNTNDFSADEKQQKRIAREMVNMGSMIRDKLKTINGLSERPIVNCITCHRGELKPAFRMPEK